MPKVYSLLKPTENAFKRLQLELRPHFLKLQPLNAPISIEEALNNSSPLFDYLKSHLIPQDVLFELKNHLVVFRKENVIRFTKDNLSTNVSNYILEYYQKKISDLSCRPEAALLLPKYIKNESPNFTITPEEWIRGNKFFDILRPRPFYDRLLAFNLDKRGTFLKVWKIQSQHNYFHPSVNSGLPLTKKKDEIHEGTFMMHDMFHYIFFDPIITGHETEEEKTVYIACRMMSEACTLVLADMIAVAHSGIENLGYDVGKRQIYPLFKSLKLNPFDIETVRKVLYANCVYCLFGETEVYKNMNATPEALELYTSKYYKFFSGDFAWNEKNISNIVNEIQANEGLKKYFDLLDEDYKSFNTRSLTKNIKRKDNKLSFNKLFEVFWSQLEELIYYNDKPNNLIYSKTCYIKYLSGQLFLACKYSTIQEAKKLIADYKICVDNIKNSTTVKETAKLGNDFINQINTFIDFLRKENLLLPHEVLVNKLHVPQFPPEYVDYDQTDENYETLEGISHRILGKFFVKEDFEYKPMPSKLRNHYLSIVKNTI
jgi:hypothetical protein